MNEKSEGSGADFPHFELEKITFEETIKKLSLDFSFGRSHYSLPKTIIPKIITNDSYLSSKLREVYSLEEFMKWCQISISKEDDRDFFVDLKHYHSNSIRPIGKEIINRIIEIIEKKINYANMNKGIADESFTDEYGQTFYSEYHYNDGWKTSNYKDEDKSEENKLYDWWYSLDKIWQNIFTEKSYYDKPDPKFIPSLKVLKSIINKKKLRITGSFMSTTNSIITIFKELDIKPLNNLKNLEDLEFRSISQLENIEILKSLTELKVLKFPNTQISTLEFIEPLINLEELDISQTNITDILDLYPLKKLTKLNCNFTKLQRLTPLQNLQELHIIGTKFSQSDIDNYEKLIGYKINNIVK